jgi:hypothetical protein
MDIQKREQLKGMLINKFKLKYGDKPQIGKFIDNEVNRFLKNDRLTEDTLRKLDSKIQTEASLREKKDAILDDRKSNRSSGRRGASRPMSQVGAGSRAGGAFDTQSVRSGRSNRSAGRRPSDAYSCASSVVARTEVYSEIAEEDQWNAI